jgi:hypothetical protein
MRSKENFVSCSLQRRAFNFCVTVTFLQTEVVIVHVIRNHPVV